MKTVLLCASAIFFSSVARAQPVATMKVTVVDPSGGVIVGAHVSLVPMNASSATVVTSPLKLDTGSRGDAVFPALTPGRYDVRVESDGFEPYVARDVRVR